MKAKLEYFSNVICTILEKLFAANPDQNGKFINKIKDILSYSHLINF